MIVKIFIATQYKNSLFFLDLDFTSKILPYRTNKDINMESASNAITIPFKVIPLLLKNPLTKIAKGLK